MIAAELTPHQESVLAEADVLLCSVSGGKDSACALRQVVALVAEKGWPGQIVTVHVDTGAEWAITRQVVINDSLRITGSQPVILQPDKDLLAVIDQRRAALDQAGRHHTPHFPTFGPGRYCTPAVKTGVIHKWIAHSYPRDCRLINITGLRADESSQRRKRSTWQAHQRYPAAPSLGREIIDWLPIHHLSEAQVWESLGWSLRRLNRLREQVRQTIQPGDQAALEQLLRQQGFDQHPAYALRSTRLSCAVCPLASANDIRVGARWNPEYARQLIQRELDSGFSLLHNHWLADLTPELLDDPQALLNAKASRENRLAAPHDQTEKRPDNRPRQLALL